MLDSVTSVAHQVNVWNGQTISPVFGSLSAPG
jgi:hypothetical protein